MTPARKVGRDLEPKDTGKTPNRMPGIGVAFLSPKAMEPTTRAPIQLTRRPHHTLKCNNRRKPKAKASGIYIVKIA